MLRKADRDRIKELLGEVECPHDYKCAASGFRYMCKAKPDDEHCQIRCLEENPENCVLAKLDEGEFRCNCPLRRYICERLGI